MGADHLSGTSKSIKERGIPTNFSVMKNENRKRNPEYFERN